MQSIRLGFSPCPNDTFLFYPLTHRLIDTGGLDFRERLEDVEQLNMLALRDKLDVTKVSYHAFAHIRDRYVLLRSGGAMGKGCGPLLVARDPLRPSDLKGGRIAAPGRLTTAVLLLRLFDPTLGNIVHLPFHQIMDAVANGSVDAGLIIHESRFTFRSYGLHLVLDLGEWWEIQTGLPLPLGAIAARRDLGPSLLSSIDRIVRSSVSFSFSHPEASSAYVGSYAQEMDEEVRAAHIRLYANEHSLDPGPEGEAAAAALFARGETLGLFPTSPFPPFLSKQ